MITPPELSKLPAGYTLKSLKSSAYFWVDGCCGFCVAHGDTEEEAINAALKSINQEKERISNGGIGSASWLVL